MNRWIFPRLHAARTENARLLQLLAYQNRRMREMASESLGMRVTLAQVAPRDRQVTR